MVETAAMYAENKATILSIVRDSVLGFLVWFAAIIVTWMVLGWVGRVLCAGTSLGKVADGWSLSSLWS
jgi:hypothetical protein